MILIIDDNRILATATDDYVGDYETLIAPEDFDAARMGEYVISDGELFIQPPYTVSMRQARLALAQYGLLGSVNTAVGQMSESAQIEWEYATEVRRDHPMIAEMGNALLWSEGQIDELFTVAAAL
jgi:hypothetical protein